MQHSRFPVRPSSPAGAKVWCGPYALACILHCRYRDAEYLLRCVRMEPSGTSVQDVTMVDLLRVLDRQQVRYDVRYTDICRFRWNLRDLISISREMSTYEMVVIRQYGRNDAWHVIVLWEGRLIDNGGFASRSWWQRRRTEVCARVIF